MNCLLYYCSINPPSKKAKSHNSNVVVLFLRLSLTLRNIKTLIIHLCCTEVTEHCMGSRSERPPKNQPDHSSTQKNSVLYLSQMNVTCTCISPVRKNGIGLWHRGEALPSQKDPPGHNDLEHVSLLTPL